MPSRIAEFGRFLAQNRGHGFGGCVPFEGAFPGHHLVEDRTKTENVGPRVAGLAPYLFRRHIADGSHHRARQRATGQGEGGFVALLGPHQLRQPEIQDFDPSVTRKEHVLRFKVAVHDSFFVGGSESLRDAQCVLDGAPHWQRAGLELFPQRHALEKLADQKRCTVVRPDVVDGQNVGVVQRGNGARFLFETAQPVCVPRQRLGQHLDRDLASEASITGAIHLSHAARAQRRLNLIRSKFRTSGKGHGCAQL